jgi:4-aminobutyrate aminotransferase
MDWHVGAHASTFGGNPVAIAASLKTIELLENGLIDNAARQGEYLMEGLHGLQRKYADRIVEIRGRGLMIGIEFVDTVENMKPVPQLRDRIVEECFARGLILIGCGASAIRFSPPLIIDRDDCDTALKIFDEAITAALGK